MKKLFVVKKYVMANSAAEAIRLEKNVKIDEVWLDEDWKKAHTEETVKGMGFKTK